MKTSQVKRHSGFTLIEVLVAILVMGFGIIAIAKLHTFMIQDSGFSNEQTIAVSLAEGKLEELRAYESLNDPDLINYQAIASPNGDWVEDQITLKSITFDRKWRVTDSSDLGLDSAFKEVEVEVSWVDAGGTDRSIQAASVISGVSPESMLGILRNFAPTGNLVQPFNRILKVPIPAVDMGDFSVYTPPGSDIQIQLDNVTGEVIGGPDWIPQIIPERTAFYLLSGFVDVTDRPAPSVMPSLEFLLVGLNSTNQLNDFECWSDSAAYGPSPTITPEFPNFVTFSCVVKSNTTTLVGGTTVPAWSGKLRLSINGVESNGFGWATSIASSDGNNTQNRFYRVCRYPLTAPDYIEVTETLANQNFFLLEGNNSNTSCPTATPQFQP